MADEEDDDERSDPKKERVLHTRVPAVLEQELKRLAKNLRVPVSNVVRSILEDALQTMESVGRKAEGELHNATERLAKQREHIRRRMEEEDEDGVTEAEVVDSEPDGDPLEGVLGFTPIVLARPARCAVSGRELKAGEEALTGIDERTDRRVIVAKDVLDRLGRERKEES